MEFLHAKSLTQGEGGKSTLKYVDVAEIRDGVIVLRSGALRAILLVSSVNFDLKSSQEQDAIIAQYQNFLNSLDFPVQIIISSRKFNVDPYLEFLGEKEKQQRNDLLRLQTAEYRLFIKELTDVSNIMSKFFYVAVPFSPVETKRGMLDKISALVNPRQAVTEKREQFETYKNQLWQRVDHVAAALSGIGINLTPLETEDLIELLYNSYNPSPFKNAIIKDIAKTEIERA
ncbi:MAG TPA: hypothetical protein VJL38_00090 [Patescibacteria group bacterium]|nr:hypothetical protein [Patescibacteria group bacterium]